ncbi:MAG: ABC transporter permease [Actinomycetota bacterium]
MNAWTQVWILAKREFLERGRSKPFIVTMGIIAVVILAIGPIANLMTGGEVEPTTLGISGEEPPGLEQELVAQGALFEVEIDIERYPSRPASESALEEGEADAVIIDSEEVMFYENMSSRLMAIIQRSVDTVVTRATLQDLGLSDDEVLALQNPVPLNMQIVEAPEIEDEARLGAAFMGAIALYISIIMFGQFVAMGTVEEKQNRVVEVVLSRVRSWQVLVGKVAGIGLLGLVQLTILAGSAYVSAQFVDAADVDIAEIGLPIIASVFFWFILGYTFYAFLYAAVGSTVSRQEDLQGAIMLPIVLILPGYLLAIVAAQDPDGLLPTIGSIMPMWAPFVMPLRIASDVAAPWEVAVAVGGSVAGAMALVWIGSRVYRGALLRTGTKVKLKDAWKAAAE